MNRREFAIAVSAMLLCTTAGAQSASSYPTKPVKLVVGFPAGQATDIIARMVTDRMAKHLGQPIVVENKPGGNMVIAAQDVIRAEPDGHTLLVHSNSLITTPAIQATPATTVIATSAAAAATKVRRRR